MVIRTKSVDRLGRSSAPGADAPRPRRRIARSSPDEILAAYHFSMFACLIAVSYERNLLLSFRQSRRGL